MAERRTGEIKNQPELLTASNFTMIATLKSFLKGYFGDPIVGRHRPSTIGAL
jgi:hypothetical protein